MAETEFDVALLLQTCGLLVTERVMADCVAAGCADLRSNDGYVFQHLLAGPRRVSDLAPLLGVTQQGASKIVADMEHRGYVVREVDERDARARTVTLTDRALLAVRTARTSRARIARELERSMGETRWARFRHGLDLAVDALGGVEALHDRRLRPPS